MNPEPLKKKVLVVDDETSLLEILELVLTEAGYETQTATNEVEGLRAFLKEPWDAVVVDRAMPEMNGEELAQAIRTLAPHIPLIMITGFIDAVSHRELFDLIIAKPFRPANLLAHLSRLLARKTGTAVFCGVSN